MIDDVAVRRTRVVGRKRGRVHLRLRPAGSCRRAIGAGLVLLAAAAPSSADDWPWWLGPRRDGISHETGWRKDWPPGGPPRIFTKEIGSGYSGIVVGDGRLILFHRVDDDLHVDCLDPATGERRWRFSYPTDYVDRYGYDGGPRCCPILHDDRVVVLDADAILHSLEASSGKKVWRQDLRTELSLESNFFGTGATPIIVDDVLYAHIGGPTLERGSGQVIALDPGDGRTLWTSPTQGGSYASPVLASIGEARHLFVFHRGGLSSFDPAGGRERWLFPWRSRLYESVNAAVPVVAGDLVFISAAYGTGSACLRVGAQGYEEVWKDELRSRAKALEIHWAPPILVEGHVYGFSGRHSNGSTLRCVELESGEVRWSWPSDLYRGSMIRSDGHFIALGEYGDLTLLELSPEGHEEVARVSKILGYPAWTVPTLANGRLYLRDLEKLICLDLRPKSEEPAEGTRGRDEG